MKHLLLVVTIIGCGSESPQHVDAASDGTAAIDVAPGDSVASAFALTSPMLAPGAAFAAANTCDGANTSPQFVWSAPPANTQSFALVLTDNSNGLVHCVIYDVPASATGLPAAVMNAYAPTNVTGAHQTASYSAAVRGYNGPCPPAGGGAHNYEFAAYALDTAALPGASMSTTRAQALTLIMQHQLGKVSLAGTYMR